MHRAPRHTTAPLTQTDHHGPSGGIREEEELTHALRSIGNYKSPGRRPYLKQIPIAKLTFEVSRRHGSSGLPDHPKPSSRYRGHRAAGGSR